MLIVLGGLPGTGKTTIGKALAIAMPAFYLRIDAIEHALQAGLPPGEKIGAQGYIAAQAIALSNLKLGHKVIADSVNPVPESRQGWQDVAAKAQSPVLEIEVICSDPQEHRRRIEGRVIDIEGFQPPSWQRVQTYPYTNWPEAGLVLDTARLTILEAIAMIEAAISVTKQ